MKQYEVKINVNGHIIVVELELEGNVTEDYLHRLANMKFQSAVAQSKLIYSREK